MQGGDGSDHKINVRNLQGGQLEWLIYIVSHLQFVTKETVPTAEYQRDEVHPVKVINPKENSIVISTFNTDISPILGVLG